MVRPAVKDQPEMDRRFRAMMVETLLAQDEVARAYDEALEFAKLYPTSGDAWKMLATASEASEQPFEADRAWGVITDKAVPTMPIWWEGMLSRVRIRNDSTRPEAACSLLVELASHNQYLPSNFKDELTAVQNGARCGG
jgi:predicted Zn-dependent protease